MPRPLHSLLPALALSVLTSTPGHATPVDAIAEQYVRLVLAMGEHDKGYVDAYYGPAEWRQQVAEAPPSPEAIASSAHQLREQLPSAADTRAASALERLRNNYLSTQLGALAAYAGTYGKDTPRDFDAEARALYDTTPPRRELSSFDSTLQQLAALLPGDAPLHQRVDEFQRQFDIPADKLSAVFDAAIEACRKRTLAHITLPAGESFQLEYVTDQPWSGYNWYRGDAHSLIQVNTDLPVRIDRAIDLGCHEGYPGHHTYNALLETEFVRQRGWVEFSVYPLFSPQSLIAEGSANYGIELAFPGEEKLRFEQQVLYPLAGLDPQTAERYDNVQDLTAELSYARNEIARQYLNGDIDREQAIELSQTYGPTSRSRAEQSVRFIDTYGAYVINYNWGKALVKDYIERDTQTNQERWQKFSALLSSPRLPSDLE
ncbi:DUF885 domain-containing protein [Parahaliea aestuarii]|uniref:DUF885 domain-containing protein n=1 Tax=Parahaliea aestuarii TaxID=1852021 RepID=A0A5C9A5D2_9GAMM|nr:DUF885 domain-containing protein [Parahaliea aestuarii]TXS94857.1 DUF885 domain-containing protein [Parahaliea aestuarii]